MTNIFHYIAHFTPIYRSQTKTYGQRNTDDGYLKSVEIEILN